MGWWDTTKDYAKNVVDPAGTWADPVYDLTGDNLDLLHLASKGKDVWNQQVKATRDSLYPDAPQSIALTPAGQAASTYANRVTTAQSTLPTPTYGQAAQVQVSRPTPPSQADYDLAAGKDPTTGMAYGPGATGTAPSTANQQTPVNPGDAASALYPGRAAPTPVGSSQTDLLAKNGGYGPGYEARSGIGHFAGDSSVIGGGADPAAVAQEQATKAASDKARADAQARIDKYNADLAQWNAIYGADAQKSDATVAATQINAPQSGYQFGMQAPTIDRAPQLGGAPQLDVSSFGNIRPLQVTAPGDIKAGTVTAQQIGEQNMGPVGDIGVGGLGRDAQIAALRNYADVANGTAPSAAQALMRKGIDENVGAALGLSATLQGNTPGAALRAGLTSAADAIAKSSASMAALRAQEQETGRAGFLTAATGIRSADIQIAQSNQTKDLTVATQNLQAHLDTLKANQQAALQAGQTNVANALQAQIVSASNRLDAAKANAANSLSADVANLTARLDASKANQAAQVQQNIANLSAALETAKANLQSALQTGLAGEASRLQASIADMNARLDASKANQQALLDAAKANMQNSQFNANLAQNQQQFESKTAADQAQANADRLLAQQVVNNNLYNTMTSNATAAVGVPVGMAANDLAAYEKWKAANAATTSGIISGVAGTYGKLFGSM